MIDLLLAAVHREYAFGTKTGLKAVACEHCGRAYHYWRTVETEGVAVTAALVGDKEAAQETARQRAEEKLARKFDRRDDPVPCPACGALQATLLDGLRKKYAEKARNWAAASLEFAIFGALGAAIWTAIGLDEQNKSKLIAGGVFAAVSLIGTVASFFTIRRLRRIWHADGKAELFRADAREGRDKLFAVETALPAVRQQLALLESLHDNTPELSVERQRLEHILEHISAVIPRVEWDRYPRSPTATEPPKPWKRKDTIV